MKIYSVTSIPLEIEGLRTLLSYLNMDFGAADFKADQAVNSCFSK